MFAMTKIDLCRIDVRFLLFDKNFKFPSTGILVQYVINQWG